MGQLAHCVIFKCVLNQTVLNFRGNFRGISAVISRHFSIVSNCLKMAQSPCTFSQCSGYKPEVVFRSGYRCRSPCFSKGFVCLRLVQSVSNAFQYGDGKPEVVFRIFPQWFPVS